MTSIFRKGASKTAAVNRDHRVIDRSDLCFVPRKKEKIKRVQILFGKFTVRQHLRQRRWRFWSDNRKQQLRTYCRDQNKNAGNKESRSEERRVGKECRS